MGYLGTKPANAAVTSEQIADGAVSTADIAANAVTTAKIADANITAAKMAAGGAWAPAGTILQVLQTTKTDTFSTSSASAVDITGMSVSITPKYTTSKILVMISMTVGPAQSNFAPVQLVRSGTNIAQPTTSSTFAATMNSYPGDAGGIAQPFYGINWIDSPSSTSAVTYKLQMYSTGGTAWVNARPAAQNGTTVSTITVMEIAA